MTRWALARQKHPDGGPCPKLALNTQPATVPVDDVFHNRKAQTRAANLALAVGVDAVKSFGQTRDVMRRNAAAGVGHSDQHRLAVQSFVDVAVVQGDGHLSARAAVFQSVFNQIGEDLLQLCRVACDVHRCCSQIKHHLDAGVLGDDQQAFAHRVQHIAQDDTARGAQLLGLAASAHPPAVSCAPPLGP